MDILLISLSAIGLNAIGFFELGFINDLVVDEFDVSKDFTHQDPGLFIYSIY